MAHISETLGTQGDTEADFGKSLFELPIRQRPTQTIDTSKKTENTKLASLDLEDTDLQESWHLLHPTDRVTTSCTAPSSSQREDQFALSDMAFERLACGDSELLEACLDAGALIEHESRDGLTLLVMAIKDSNIAMTGLLLQKGADAQHRTQGKPPLFHAIHSLEHGPKLIQLLLDHGANINTTCGTQHMNALHWAAAAGMVDAADYLISRGVNIEATCAGAYTALHVAAGTGHLTVAKLLLAQGAELSKRGELLGNALTFAACRGHTDIVKLCLEEGQSADDCDGTGLTALMSACELGHLHIAEYLLEKGADVNRANAQLSTPALEAAAKGYADILQALITAGANLDSRTTDGENVLEVAMSKGHTGAIRLLLETLGGFDYPVESVSLEIASAREIETMRSLMKTASLMHAHMGPKTEMQKERAWVKWVLENGGDLVRPQTIFNMMIIAVSEADADLVEALLYNGADPNVCLSTAVVNRNLDIVQLLLNHGAGTAVSARCIKRPDGRPDNVLLDALLNMSYQKDTCLTILKLLLDSGRFNILAGPSSNQTAFWRVLESDEWDPVLRDQVAFMMLDSVTDVNYPCNGDGGTLMHHVVRYGREDMVDLLLKKGANINAQDNEGRTPFILACDYQHRMILFLVKRGADPGLPYEDDRGPLHAAATVGNVKALGVLLTLRSVAPNFDQKSRDGWTPLACALAADQEEAALFLIEYGANMKHTVAVNGRTMLHLAAAFGHERVFEKIMALNDVNIDTRDSMKNGTALLLTCSGTRYKAASSKIVRALLSAGTDIEAPGSHLDRPLHVAIMTCNTAIAKILIEYGADVTATGSKGRTPLHLAAGYKNPDIMHLLLQKGATIEAVDEDGWTPLHLCTESISAQILIEHGANIDLADRNGLIPLHHAVLFGGVELFTTLQENGASIQIRAMNDGRNAIDMIEDFVDGRTRNEFLAAVKGAPIRYRRTAQERENRECR